MKWTIPPFSPEERKEIQKELVAALRSGKYRKVCGHYRYNLGYAEAYCALGVLREIVRPRLPKLEAEDYSATGIADALGICTNGVIFYKIIELSDNNETFGPVADYIEGLEL